MMVLFATHFVITSAVDVDVDVVILGAGGSGLAAAHQLEELGISYAVVEARDEIGGRMRTHDLNGVKVQHGANWIQGVAGSMMWGLAQKSGLKGAFQDWDNGYISAPNERSFDEDAVWNASEAAFECVGQLAAKLQENTVLWGSEYSRNGLDIRQSLRICGWNRAHLTAAEMAAEWFEIDYECATEPGETSLAGTHPLNVYADFDDRDFFVTDERGWLPALEAMGWDSAKIMLNKTILKVESTPQRVRVDYADSTTGGVGSITAAYAISTFSLGVLQHSHAEIFSPALPIWKQFELAKFEMAAYLKIFIQFETHFWGEDEYVLYASPTRGYYPHWQNLDAPGFSNGTNTILVTLTGNWARRAELMTDEAILAEAVAVLGEIFGAENVTTATGIFVGRWVTDPLTRGMFSNWPTGVSDVDFIGLSTAVDRVLFAGEATHPKYNGYVHGALLSGINSAASAAACLGNTSSDKCNCAYNRLCDTYTGTTHPAHDQQDQQDPAHCPTAEGVNTQDAAAATCLAASVAALTIAAWWMDT